jgi:hypothetical protein
LVLNGKYWRQRMALPAANLRFFYIHVAFRAICRNIYFSTKNDELARDLWGQHQVWTGIGGQNIRNGAGFAQIRGPLNWSLTLINQAAFFMITATIIVTVKILALFTSRCSHAADYSIRMLKNSPHQAVGRYF